MNALPGRLPVPGTFLRQSQIIGSKRCGIAPLIPIGKTTLWKYIKEGRFPKPLKLGPRCSVWKAEDVIDWINDLEKGE